MFDESELNKEQKEMRSRLCGKSGGGHLLNNIVAFATEKINPEIDSGMIALKCGETIFCMRDHCEYQHYRISDRSECPKTCALNNNTYNGL